jgi:beta-glucosidase-like glycosyl hydrolase/CubicO group peptidase (beta-lactamase class C family)
MSLDEKVGQLFMVSAYSNKDEAHAVQIENFIRQYKLGGLIFMQGTPEKQVELINRYQKISKLPLMIGFDGEWGLAMRLQNTINYPRQLLLGAIQNDLLIYEMGREFARQMRRVGIHVNFAPVVDVNNNPANPVINDRSFGDNISNVIKKGIMYMKGLQDGGVMACAKHFPGHGDTDIDSHYDLPVIKHSRERLEMIELKPFRAMAQNGVGSMMIAHLSIPALDNTPNLPSSLSPKIVSDILRAEMKYDGLLFTDAMNMKGVSKFFPSGVAEVKALQAGNDIILFPDNVPQAINGVKKAIADNTLDIRLLEEKVRRILMAKYWLGLQKFEPLSEFNIMQEVQTAYSYYLNEKLTSAAITVISNDAGMIPLGDISRFRIASVNIGSTRPNVFTETLDKYAPITHHFIPKDASPAAFNELLAKLKAYNLVICGIQDMSRFASKQFGLSEQSIQFVKNLDNQQTAITVIFNTPYSLNKFQTLKNGIIAYSEDAGSQSAAAQVIFGAIGATGELPVAAGSYQRGEGLCTNGKLRLSYASPLSLGIHPDRFNGIERIVNEAINMGAMPGCQVLVAYQGSVIYDKAFGKTTYEGNQKVTTSDLYDIASITKVAATTPVLMHLYEKGLIKPEGKLGDYLHINGNKKGLTLKEMLAHQAGLQAWIPFYKNTLDATGKPSPLYYKTERDSIFNLQVAKNLFIRSDYRDSILQTIQQSPLNDKSYKYSDLGFYFYQRIIENQFGKSLDEVADSLIWSRLGATSTMYNPLSKGIPINRIVPTEKDNSFRMQTIQGTVHDQGAAMMGGVAGHAGLFSNANDLAKYFQMLLNGGTYGGVRFFDQSTIELFTSKAFNGNRRALAFDKPAPNGDGPTCAGVSERSFGHTGFTGTIAWADPDNDIIFIFLSNRTYPNAENKLLINQNIRPRIQEVIYKAIKNPF